LQQLTEAQDAQTEAIDKVRDAKERELETTRNLAKAEILLRKAKGGLTKKSLKYNKAGRIVSRKKSATMKRRA
jgi:hypothetical protein